MSLVRLNFYIKNNFGPEHVPKFTDLTAKLVEHTDNMTKNNISILSPNFQNFLIQESVNFLSSHYPEDSFEFFFQKVNDDYYFVVNNIHRHSALKTPNGKFLHDWCLINLRMQ